MFLINGHKFVLWHRNDRGRSPDRGTSWSDRFKNRDRSRSPDRIAPPQHSQVSFHKAMMERGAGDNERNKSFTRERSRSPSPYKQERAPAARERSPVYSFHRSIVEKGQSSPPSQQQRVPPYNDESCKQEKSSSYAPSSPSAGKSNNSSQNVWGGSLGDGRYGGSHDTYNGEEEEEGMIPDEEGMIAQDDGIYQTAD